MSTKEHLAGTTLVRQSTKLSPFSDFNSIQIPKIFFYINPILLLNLHHQSITNPEPYAGDERSQRRRRGIGSGINAERRREAL